jgi:hypothetical protein
MSRISMSRCRGGHAVIATRPVRRLCGARDAPALRVS